VPVRFTAVEFWPSTLVEPPMKVEPVTPPSSEMPVALSPMIVVVAR
jgi:hypothetical protein